VNRVQRLRMLGAKLASYHRIASSRQQTYVWSGIGDIEVKVVWYVIDIILSVKSESCRDIAL